MEQPPLADERSCDRLLGLIAEGTVRGEKPPVEVAYPLTPFGRRFVKILREVRRLQEELDGGAASMSDSGARGRGRGGILPS